MEAPCSLVVPSDGLGHKNYTKAGSATTDRKARSFSAFWSHEDLIQTFAAGYP